MPITASDLALYGSTGRPLDDVSPVGGDIDTGARPISMQLSSAQAIEFISSSSGDTRTASVIYRTTNGNTLTWAPTLAGTCAVALSTGTPNHILRAELSSAHATRTVTLRVSSGAMIHTINPGEYGAFCMFPYSYSKASSAVVRYEKLFLLNLSTDTALQSGTLQLTSDASTQFRIGVESAIGATGGWANRLTTAGGGFTFGDTGAVSLPASLGASEYIGIAIEQTLAAGASERQPTFLLTPAGLALVST